MICLVCLFVLVATCLASSAHADMKFSFHKKNRALQLFDYPDRQVINFTGEMMPGQTTKPMHEMLSKLVPGKDIVVLIGASGGGEAKRFTGFGNALRAACPKESCKITTYVHKTCGSACVWLFMYGDERLCSSIATFGFHRKFVGALGIEIVVQSRDDLAKRFISMGADADWMNANIDRLTANQKQGVYVSPAQMMNAKMVTGVDDLFLYRMQESVPVEFLYSYGIPKGGMLLEEASDPR